MAQIQFFLLGKARVVWKTIRPDVTISQGTLRLLAYLLTNGPRSHSRNRVAGILWPDMDEDRAHRCLSTALWRLRSFLEPVPIPKGLFLITSPRDRVGFNWNSNLWVDLLEFEQIVGRYRKISPAAISERDESVLKHALSLYKGEFLEGLYDQWILDRREELHELFLDGMKKLMQYYQFQGQDDLAILTGRKILATDPFQEDVHRVLAALYLRTGRRNRAVQQLETCHSLISGELGVGLHAETRKLQALLSMDSPTVSPERVTDDLQRVMDELSRISSELSSLLTRFRQIVKVIDMGSVPGRGQEAIEGGVKGIDSPSFAQTLDKEPEKHTVLLPSRKKDGNGG